MITLKGLPIGRFAVKLPHDAPVDLKNAAARLTGRVAALTGALLPVVTEGDGPAIRLTADENLAAGRVRAYFDGNDLVLTGGHVLSAADAAERFAAKLNEGAAFGADFEIDAAFGKVPLFCPRYPGMKLVWNDEFDFDGGDLFDRRKWIQRPQMAAKDVLNGKSARNVMTENSELVLRSWKEEGELPYSTNMSMTTCDSLNYCYGYLEMRAMVPFLQGAWPSFWMISKPEYTSEAYNTEIDIFEVVSSKDRLVPNIHKWYHAPDRSHYQLEPERKPPYVFEQFGDLSNEYHNYGFYWDREKMVFSVDGQDYCTFDITENGDFGAKPGMGGFHVPCYIILNNFLFTELASWKPKDSLVNAQTPYPVTYRIDWMRLYQDETGILHKPSEGDGYQVKF